MGDAMPINAVWHNTRLFSRIEVRKQVPRTSTRRVMRLRRRRRLAGGEVHVGGVSWGLVRLTFPTD
jgi:hypothetical protein